MIFGIIKGVNNEEIGRKKTKGRDFYAGKDLFPALVRAFIDKYVLMQKSRERSQY